MLKILKRIIALFLLFIILETMVLTTKVHASLIQNIIGLLNKIVEVQDGNSQYTIESIKTYYYNQLNNELSKRTYNALVNATSNTVTINVADLNLTTTETTQEGLKTWVQNNCRQYLNDGIEAYTEDSGNYWWQTRLNSWKEHFKGSTINNNLYVLDYIILTSNKDVKYDNQEEFNNKLTEACNSISGNTVYEKVKNINQYICDNVEYGYVEDSNMYRTAYGALIEKKAISEGYSQLFNLMCRKLGINSLCVYGNTINSKGESKPNAWNYVYEPDKKEWYAVDCTWNDELNCFIMVGSDTKVDNVQELGTFGENHKPGGYKAYDIQTFSPSVPNLAKNEFNVQVPIPEIDETITSSVYIIENDIIKNIQPNMNYEEFVKNISSNQQYVVKEDNNVITIDSTIKTGQVLTIGDKNYTLIVLGDTNCDGKADLKDILQINKHRLKKELLTGIYLEAGDVNNDGKNDVKDILHINKYRLGKISQI